MNIKLLGNLTIVEIVYIGSSFIFIVLICLLYILYNKIYGRANAFNYRKLRRFTSCFYRPKHHPKYTPIVDSIKNKYLPLGHCNICDEKEILVFVLTCSHSICIEDMKGYINSSLSNIAMFPLKCPLHVEGCNGIIDAHTAKRVLNKLSYKKFLELSDRTTLGEGMRCLSCFSYISLIIPKQTNTFDNKAVGNIIGNMAICSYCYDKYCIRCKLRWHFNSQTCPLDQIDESLEKWKTNSGAQKCPSCLKVIEKEDENTCHHMVHKLTDSIPCCRERTDFCYLCGYEVTPNYPHEEVVNIGINHFPDGVFQKCRMILNKEKEKQREKLKRLRRLNIHSPIRRNVLVAPIYLEFDIESSSVLPTIPNNNNSNERKLSSVSAFDHIDQQWRNVENKP